MIRGIEVDLSVPRNCPSLERLLGYALEEERMNPLELEQHLVACEDCKDDVATIRQAVVELRISGSVAVQPGDPCLDEFERIELAEGADGVDRRRPMLRHVASCPTCRKEVAGLSRALADPAIARELIKLDTTHEPVERLAYRKVGMIGAVAAAAVLAFVLVPRVGHVDNPPADPQHRARELTAMGAPVAMITGAVTLPVVLSWQGVPTADLYKVTLYDAHATVLWESRLRDSSATIPASISLVPDTSYFWKVEARTDFDRWAASELVGITVVRR